jgi:hypothetical protein
MCKVCCIIVKGRRGEDYNKNFGWDYPAANNPIMPLSCRISFFSSQSLPLKTRNKLIRKRLISYTQRALVILFLPCTLFTKFCMVHKQFLTNNNVSRIVTTICRLLILRTRMFVSIKFKFSIETFFYFCVTKSRCEMDFRALYRIKYFRLFLGRITYRSYYSL